jgi:hypothetical protein
MCRRGGKDRRTRRPASSRGHEFGLDSSAEDKAALIAFLKTLSLSCP